MTVNDTQQHPTTPNDPTIQQHPLTSNNTPMASNNTPNDNQSHQWHPIIPMTPNGTQWHPSNAGQRTSFHLLLGLCWFAGMLIVTSHVFLPPSCGEMVYNIIGCVLWPKVFEHARNAFLQDVVQHALLMIGTLNGTQSETRVKHWMEPRVEYNGPLMDKWE